MNRSSVDTAHRIDPRVRAFTWRLLSISAAALTIAAGMIWPSAASAAAVLTVDAHTDNARLIDSNGDDLGDTAAVFDIANLGLGENNGGAFGTDEGRWWLPFDLSGYQAAIAGATSVRLSMQTDVKQNVAGHQLDIYGFHNRTSVTAVAADYQAPAALLVQNAFNAGTPDDTMRSFNVTGFVKAEAAAGPNPLAVFRVQVAPPDWPNADSVRNNFIMWAADAPAGQRPILSITPQPEYLETREFHDLTFTTAANNGESPATSGAFVGAQLYVRERLDNATNQQVRAFLQFDLADLGTTNIDSATLMLHEYNKLNNANSAALWIGQVADAWDTAGNPPVFDQAIVTGTDFSFGDNGPASAGPAVDITFAIDVTDIVKAWQADPSSNRGFRLWLSPGFVGAAFDEGGANAPLLIVQYGAPEPATLGLLAVGGMGLVLTVRRKRRRRS